MSGDGEGIAWSHGDGDAVSCGDSVGGADATAARLLDDFLRSVRWRPPSRALGAPGAGEGDDLVVGVPADLGAGMPGGQNAESR